MHLRDDARQQHAGHLAEEHGHVGRGRVVEVQYTPSGSARPNRRGSVISGEGFFFGFRASG